MTRHPPGHNTHFKQKIFNLYTAMSLGGFACSSVAKNPPANGGAMGVIPGSGRSPGEGNGNPLQYSCLGNPTDREAWWTTVQGVQRVGQDLVTEQQQMSLVVGHMSYGPRK